MKLKSAAKEKKGARRDSSSTLCKHKEEMQKPEIPGFLGGIAFVYNVWGLNSVFNTIKEFYLLLLAEKNRMKIS